MSKPNTSVRRNHLYIVVLSVTLLVTGCARVGLQPAVSPQEAELAYQRGTVALEAGRYSDAVPELRTVLRARPEDTVVRYNLGLALQRLRSFRESVQVFTGWGERDLDLRRIDRRIRVPYDADADYIYALGNSYQGLRELNYALKCFEDAIHLYPTNLNSRYARAMLLQQRGDLEEARLAWIDYIDRDPNSAWTESARRNLREVERELQSATP
jgi:tetratricopeptide (TPR) repeat protein